MPMMLYTYPVVSNPLITSMTGPFNGFADIDLTFPNDSSSYIMGGYVLLDDSIIPYGTDFTSLGSVEQVGFQLGQTIIAPGETHTIHVTTMGINTIRIILYNQVDGLYDLHPDSMSRTFSITVQAVPLRVTITPDRGTTYTEPTIFQIYFPYEYGGLVVIGDAELPVDYTGSIYPAQNKGDFIYSDNSVRIGISEPTRVRIYYYPSMSYHGYYYDLDTFFDDFIIDVQAAPRVTVEDYGKSVSFETSTIVKLKSNIPCELTYTIIDLEDKQQAVEVVTNIGNSLSFNIELYASTILKFKAKANNYVTELKEYFFIREPSTVKRSYSYYTENGQLTNNLYNDTFWGPIIERSYGEMAQQVDPSQVMQVGQFDFSPITNSFIAGKHPAYSRPHLGGWYYDFTNYNNYLNISYIYRIHYKTVGFSYFAGNCNASMAIANFPYTSLYVDSDGWLIGLAPINSQAFTCQFNKPSGIITDETYFEIDYFEIIPQAAYSNVSFNFIPQSTFGSLFEQDTQVQVFNTPEDPVFVMAVTTDGSTPDITTDLVTNLVDFGWAQYFIDHISTSENIALFQRIYYQGFLADSIVPSVFTERISKLVNNEIGFLPTFEANIEDFKLGNTKFGWTIPSWQSEDKRFRFLPEGLVSPHIWDGYAGVSSQWFYNVTGRHVIIDYEVKLAPGCYQLNGYVQISISNGNSSWFYIYDGNSNRIETDLWADYTQINITFYSYAYMQGGSYLDPSNQSITIKRIEFVDRKRQDINIAPLIPAAETWENDIPVWPWVFNGNWGPAPVVTSPYDSTYFMIPPNIGDNEYSVMSFDVDCIDGNVEFYWGISSEQDADFCNFYVDFNQLASISGSIDPSFMSFYVPLGMHKFSWEFVKDGNTSIGADTPFITDIRFPTVSGVVVDKNTQSQFTYQAYGTYYSYAWTWEKGSTFLDYRPKGFGATINAYSYDSKSMSVTLPLAKTNYNLNMYFYMSVVAMGDTYYYPIHLDVTCNWDNYYADGYYTTEVFGTNLQYTGYYNPGGRSLPRNAPETGTITFTLTGTGAPFDTTVYFPYIQIPTPTANIVDINPKEDVISIFPFECSMMIGNPLYDVYYTLDNSDPQTSSTAKKYMGPINITEGTLIKYRPYYKSTSYWLQLESKIYTKQFNTCEILKHVYLVSQQTYVVFYTIPWQVPILIGEMIDGRFQTRLYDGLPILTNPGHIFTIGHVTIIGEPSDRDLGTEYHFNTDYNSFRLMEIPAEINNTWPREIELVSAVEEETQGFGVRVISSIPSGAYNHPISITLRSNFPECEIYYTLEDK